MPLMISISHCLHDDLVLKDYLLLDALGYGVVQEKGESQEAP